MYWVCTYSTENVPILLNIYCTKFVPVPLNIYCTENVPIQLNMYFTENVPIPLNTYCRENASIPLNTYVVLRMYQFYIQYWVPTFPVKYVFRFHWQCSYSTECICNEYILYWEFHRYCPHSTFFLFKFEKCANIWMRCYTLFGKINCLNCFVKNT